MNDEKKINTIYDLMAFCYKKICEEEWRKYAVS